MCWWSQVCLHPHGGRDANLQKREKGTPTRSHSACSSSLHTPKPSLAGTYEPFDINFEHYTSLSNFLIHNEADGMKSSEEHRRAELPASGKHQCLLAHGEQVPNTCRMAPPHHRHAQRTTLAPSVIHGPSTERAPRYAREA
jgi:hypothetical protein